LPIETTDVNMTRAEVALKDKLIIDCTEDEVKIKLKLIYSMVGLRSQFYPMDGEKQNLHDYIRLKFGNKTLSELVLAFDLAINNELDIKQEDVKVYDQFTIAYMAQIMSAYKSWLYGVYKNLKVKKDYPKMVEDKKILTNEEKAEWICEWKQMQEINIELIPLMFYEFLDSQKIILLTAKQKWEYTQKATHNVKSRLFDEMGVCKTNDAYLAYNKFQNQEKEGFDGEFKGRILNRAKRLIVFDYLRDNLPENVKLS